MVVSSSCDAGEYAIFFRNSMGNIRRWRSASLQGFKRYVDARVENIKTIKTIKNSPANLLKVALQNANENKSNIENKINAYVENLVDAFLKNNITENAESVRNLLIKFYFFINR